MSAISLKQPKTYYDSIGSSARIQVHQGGTRSGKTFSLCQVIITWCLENENAGWVLTIVRKTMPSLRASVMRDFIQILETEGWYSEAHHNKSSCQYRLFGNLIEFISVDQPAKIRGRKRNLCFINEANELTYEDYQQLILRTTDIVVLDYNPSDYFSWIYDRVLVRDDCDFFKTTYRDNPFLDATTIKEIERLQLTDENYWRIYGLGERGTNVAAIFPSFEIVDEVPERAKFISHALDWGFTNDPSAFVSVYKDGIDLYMVERLYETGLTNSDLAERLRPLVDGREEIIADSAEPKSIQELFRQGFNIKSANKGPDSIRIGIDVMKRHRLYVTRESSHLIKELLNYKWRTDKDGRQINIPEAGHDHAIDAVRYVCLNKLTTNYSGQYFIS